MPRPKSPVPAYSQHAATGQAVVRVALPDGRPKDVYLSVHGSPESRAEYARVLALVAANSGTYPAAGPALSVNQVLLAYLKHAHSYYRDADGRPTDAVGLVRLAFGPVKRLFGHAPAAEFGPKALKAVREVMVADGLCRKSVNTRVGVIKKAFRWAVSEELVPAAVFLLAMRGPVPAGRAKVVGDQAPAVAPRPAGPAAPQDLPAPPARVAPLGVASEDACRIAADPWFAGRASAGTIEAMIERASRLSRVVVVYDQDGRFAVGPHEGYKDEILDLWGTVFYQSATGGSMESFGFPGRVAATDFRVFLVPRFGANRRDVVRLAETSLVTMSYRGLLATDKRQSSELERMVEDLKRDTEKGR